MIDDKTLRENFQSNLNQLLTEGDKKQIDLANYLGVSTSIVNDWCKGRKIPRVDKIAKIAKYFGVDSSDMLTKSNIPDYSPDYLTLIELYSRLDDKGKQAVMSLARTLAE